MALHKFIPDSRIPLPLKNRLVFGNREQIDALYALEEDINLIETERAAKEIEQNGVATGKLKYFDVTIEYGGTQEIRVLAVDKYDAREKAKEEADHGMADIEIDSISVREVKK